MLKDIYSIDCVIRDKNGKKIMENKNTPLSIHAESIDNIIRGNGNDKRKYILYFNKISNKEFYQVAHGVNELKKILSDLRTKSQYIKIRVMKDRPLYAERR